MAVTSVQVASTELLSAGRSTVSRETLYALTAGVPKEPRLVRMADRAPAYVGETPKERSIPLIVFLLDPNEDTRRGDWLEMLELLDSSAALVPIAWTDGSTTYRYWCSVTDAHAEAQFSAGTATLIAPEPTAEVVT